MDLASDRAFTDFQARVRGSELYKRNYVYYLGYTISVTFGVILSFYFITVTDSLILQIFNAIFLGFVFVQGGMLGHDLSHEQVFVSRERNMIFASIVWGLIGGISAEKWFKKHNNHHLHVNQIGKDPDLDMPFVFSQKQLPNGERGFMRFLRGYQHTLFFIVLPLVYLYMVGQAYLHIFKHFSTRLLLDAVLMAVHFGTFIVFLVIFLPWYVALLFFVVHMFFMGVYMSLVFAPNHKGERILAEDEISTWRDQITCTRNIYPSALIFHVFGGLNFQIEHHLFSNMARTNYPKVRPLVKEFCASQGIRYHETSWGGSLREIYNSLKQNAV